ncbi:arginine--tRNA ligase, partial [Candidatus Curtissbacteria bacterium]|nr:arginine--tRNA ligase [Candidatus Curtissbacteria bacterium]
YPRSHPRESASVEVFPPENEKFGHYSTNVALKLAKLKRKNPLLVAEEIVSKLKAKNSKLFAKIEIAPPGFINFWIKKEVLIDVTKEIIQKKGGFGWGSPKKETIVIEYSSPNIAKPLGVHHLRSTIIGQALVNILRFVGYRVISLSFPGDWGTQFGLLIAGYKRWGDPQKIKKEPINEMLRLYIKFSKAAKENSELLNEGRNEFKKLEEGDKENKKLWKWFLDESLRDFERVYKLLGVKIENTIGESFYEPELKSLVEDALRRGLAQKGKDGSVVIPLPESSVPEIIQKSDGATIYTTRELAAIRHRLKKWGAQKILYVAANQQTFHLHQVFRSAEILGFAKSGQLGHIKFGMMLGPGGKKFATREGRLIPLEDVLNEAIKRSLKSVQKLNPKLPKREKERVSKVVGIGAVKFFDLSQNRLSDIIFEWDKILNLRGSTAPYIQYSYARLKSILRKGRGFKKVFDSSLLTGEEESKILHYLAYFPEIIEDSAMRYDPNIITKYLLDLAEKANAFYETTPVLKAARPLRDARLTLTEAVTIILKNGLNLLGIKAPERM